MDEIARMREMIRAYAEKEAVSNDDFSAVGNMNNHFRLQPGADARSVVNIGSAFPRGCEICVLLHPFKRQKNGISPVHRHTYFEMGFVFQGEGVSISDGEETRLSEGDLFLVSPQALHQMKTFSMKDHVFNVMIQRSLLDEHFLCLIAEYDLFSQFFMNSILNQPSDRCLVFRSGTDDTFTFYIYKIICEALFSEDYDQNYLRLLLACLFRELSRQYQKSMEEKSRQENEGLSISEVLQYLMEQYAQATLQSTAEHFHYSTRFISSFVAQYTGSSFGRILREIKLQNASRLVRQTRLSYEEIACEVGYNGRDYLDRLFKNRYGKTMNEYRNEYRRE